MYTHAHIDPDPLLFLQFEHVLTQFTLTTLIIYTHTLTHTHISHRPHTGLVCIYPFTIDSAAQ